MEKNQQELIFKLSVFEQQIQQLQQQLQAVEQGLIDLSSLNLGLDDFKKSENKEIFAPIGRGIFIKAKILSENLTVDVGGKNFVQKTIPQTKELIEEQIKKLEEIKKELSNNLEDISMELDKTMLDAKKQEKVSNTIK